MKKLTALIYILILLVGCESKRMNNSKLDMSINLDSNLTKIINKFVQETNCQKCLNDITIDKILPDSTIITIRTQTPYFKYFRENPNRRQMKVNDISFYYYTGAEQFINNIGSDSTYKYSDNNNCSLIVWTYVKSRNKDTLYYYGGVPFYYPDFSSPPQKVDFLPRK